MALTPERRQELERISNQSTAVSGSLTPQRRQELQGIIDKSDRTLTQKALDVGRDIAQPLAKTVASGVAPIAATGELLKGGPDAPARAEEQLTRERRTVFGKARPVGVSQETGKELPTGRAILDILGTGAELGSLAVPAGTAIKAGTIGARAISPALRAGARLGATEGALQLGGRELQQPSATPASVAGQAALGGAGGAIFGGAARALGRLGRGAVRAEAPVTKPAIDVAERGATFATEQVGRLPSRIINSVIRPANRAFSFGKNPGKTVAELGIVANSIDDLGKQIKSQRSTIGGQISDLIAAAPATRSINRKSIIAPLDDAIRKAASDGEQALVTRLQNVRQSLTTISRLDPNTGKVVTVGTKNPRITAQEAFELKKKIGSRSKWTGQAFDNDVNQATVAVFRKLKAEIERVVEPKQRKELRRLNGIFGNLVEADSAIQRRVANAERVNLLSLPQIGVAGVGGIAAGGPGAIIGLALNKLAGTVAFKTRLAKGLQSALDSMPGPDQQVAAELLPKLAPAIAELSEKEAFKFVEALPSIIKLIRFGVLDTVAEQTTQ